MRKSGVRKSLVRFSQVRKGKAKKEGHYVKDYNRTTKYK